MGVPTLADRGYSTSTYRSREQGHATFSGKLVTTFATIFGFIVLLVYSFTVASAKIGCSLSAKILKLKVALSPNHLPLAFSLDPSMFKSP